jgi:hypothetical protein
LLRWPCGHSAPHTPAPPDPFGLRGPCPRRSSLPAGIIAFTDVDAARPPRAPFGGQLTTRQDSHHGTDCPLVPSLFTRFGTPLSRPLCSERPGLTTWPAGGYHGRTCTGWSTKPSPGALHEKRDTTQQRGLYRLCVRHDNGRCDSVLEKSHQTWP